METILTGLGWLVSGLTWLTLIAVFVIAVAVSSFFAGGKIKAVAIVTAMVSMGLMLLLYSGVGLQDILDALSAGGQEVAEVAEAPESDFARVTRYLVNGGVGFLLVVAILAMLIYGVWYVGGDARPFFAIMMAGAGVLLLLLIFTSVSGVTVIGIGMVGLAAFFMVDEPVIGTILAVIFGMIFVGWLAVSYTATSVSEVVAPIIKKI